MSTQLELKIEHLLNRAAFGSRPRQVAELIKKGPTAPQQWLEQQLRPETINDSATEKKLLELPGLHMNLQQLRQAYSKDDEMASRPKAILWDLYAQKTIRAISSERQLQEVMVNFWFNHFNVDFKKGRIKHLLIGYERDTIRPHIWGSFRLLLGAVAKSPAMQFYLDNYQSVRDGFVPHKKKPGRRPGPTGLNENYARELLELHTVGVDAGYNQNDVREVARAFTGWTLDDLKDNTRFAFHRDKHDAGAKKVMSLSLPPDRGIEDGEDVLDYLATHPATARFIAKKLAIKFVSDQPPTSLVERLAQKFQATQGDLRSVYQELFQSPEFWSPSVYRVKIKTPFEFVASAARAVEGVPIVEDFHRAKSFQVLTDLGEPPYNCQPPTGFKATNDFWVNAGALVTRINFALALTDNRVSEIYVDIDRIQKHIKDQVGHDHERWLDELNKHMLGGSLRPETRRLLLSELANETKTEDHPFRISKLLGLILGSPEFQRR